MNRIQSFLTSAALAVTLSACGSEATLEAPEDGTPVTMDWAKGETFYLATSYRRTAVKTEENPVNMAAAFNGTAIPSFGESWTEDIIWTYQVVESNFVPSADDESSGTQPPTPESRRLRSSRPVWMRASTLMLRCSRRIPWCTWSSAKTAIAWSDWSLL